MVDIKNLMNAVHNIGKKGWGKGVKKMIFSDITNEQQTAIKLLRKVQSILCQDCEHRLHCVIDENRIEKNFYALKRVKKGNLVCKVVCDRKIKKKKDED